MNSIEKLTRIFAEFPGIGPRQARRFVYYLLTRANGTLEELSKNIAELKKDISTCPGCRRFYEKKYDGQAICNICSDSERESGILMLVQRDIDLESIEKTGNFNGVYFVLGGSVPILEKEPEKRIRVKDLESRIKEDKKIKEIILGVNWNPEGENTGIFVERFLKSLAEERKIKITHLGKGLSMVSELEYTDPDTLKNALKNRQ